MHPIFPCSKKINQKVQTLNCKTITEKLIKISRCEKDKAKEPGLGYVK